jgi:putative DNA primase/helicase
MTDPVEQFREAIRAAGLMPPDVIEADGMIRRFDPSGKRGATPGWYALHLDGITAGIFGDWRSGLSQTWTAKRGSKLTQEEAAQQRATLDAMRRRRDDEKRRGQETAATKAAELWQAAQPAPENHGYLKRKGIQAHGTRVDANGWLLVPMRDAAGKMWNLECIAPSMPDGGGTDKQGLYQGRRTGCYYVIGNTEGTELLCIAEGFATGASIHEATGLPVALAFNAGNLEHVATALRRAFPALPLLICADDDWQTEGNPGRTKGNAAAKAVGGFMVLPTFRGARSAKATDFNDLAQAEGIEAVERIVGGAVASIAAPWAEPHPDAPESAAGSSDLGASDPAATGRESTPEQALFPGARERPCYVVLDDWQEWRGRKYRAGVWYCGKDEDKHGNITLTETWFCSPLYVDAVTFDGQENNFGRLLRFRSTIGRWREWAMPMELLRGSGEELRGELLAMGVELDHYKGRSYLPAYLQSQHPKRRMRCALQVGWCGAAFVLPDAVIGPDAASVIFQSGERGHEEHGQGGALDGWRTEIAARAVDNPLFALGLSAAFAGPMLARCNAEGGGIHFVGDSSTGKTTILEAAASVWGGGNYRRSWRATANGMEGAAALFNDCLLALDEISECDPREVGNIVYSLGNGRGKQRAWRTGAARAITRWRAFIVSTGERTIATTMTEGGHRFKAGQSVRLLDVPTARQHGCFDVLHGYASGAALSDAIKRAVVTHHGRVGREFLHRLTHDQRDFAALLERLKGLPGFNRHDFEGQDKRAAGRLALVALAGEVATEYGLTGWPDGEAVKSAVIGFNAWRSLRGWGNDERRQILQKVSDFIERHGDSRFSDMDGGGDSMIRDRAGWWRDGQEGRIFFFTAEGMREALKGFDFNRALDELEACAALPKPGVDGKRSRFVRIAGRGMRLYQIHADRLAGDENGAC